MKDIPKTPDKPVNGFHGRAQQQVTSNEGKESLQNSVQLLILSSVHLCSVLRLALFAEDGALERRETRIELT